MPRYLVSLQASREQDGPIKSYTWATSVPGKLSRRASHEAAIRDVLRNTKFEVRVYMKDYGLIVGPFKLGPTGMQIAESA